MNIQAILKTMINAGIEENEAKSEIKLILNDLFSYTEKNKLLGEPLSDEQIKIVEEIINKRINERIPIQHLIGKARFMGECFKVNNHVLIPRDETEILVRKAIELINTNRYTSVLDIGTGSGCIACTIAKQTSAVVLGVDISSDALRVALDNVTNLNINNRAVFRKSDLFSKIRDDEKFDIIVSNPPYIPYGTELEPEVLKEPEIALFADNNGLEFYEKIIASAPEYLNNRGYLLFEVGINEADEVKKLMSENFTDITAIKDMANIERVIYGRLK